MDPWMTVTSRAAALLRANVDTDIITPMRRITGRNARPLADYAFEAWRYDNGDADTGRPVSDFVLNRPEAAGAAILLTGENFGCGSSRETAPRALADLGFRCLIGSSFGDIFFSNCFQQGILPIIVDQGDVDQLVRCEEVLTVDLEAQTIRSASGIDIGFEVNELRKTSLLLGLDDIELTLSMEAEIAAFQERDQELRPWVYEL